MSRIVSSSEKEKKPLSRVHVLHEINVVKRGHVMTATKTNLKVYRPAQEC